MPARRRSGVRVAACVIIQCLGGASLPSASAARGSRSCGIPAEAAGGLPGGRRARPTSVPLARIRSALDAQGQRWAEKENGMERIFRWVLTLLIVVVAGLEFIQVVTRYVFKIPVMGLEEVLIYFALWLYVLGSVNA